MSLSRYVFDNCIGAFVEMSTDDARRLLPPHLQPLEVQHTRSVLAMLAFQFTESEVGAYDELVMAIITPPRVEAGRPIPKSAFFPFAVATSTADSREHGTQRWHLPHYMEDLDFEYDQRNGSLGLSVSERGREIVDLTVTDHDFNAARNDYHCFTVEGDRRFQIEIAMEGHHSEHEFEEGNLVLHEHPMMEGLTLEEVEAIPFREEHYRGGVQTFEAMETF